jgi:hypothetical protein
LLGDGTVPEHSANGYNFPIPQRQAYYLPGVEHMDLVSDPNALYLVGQMAAGMTCNSSQFQAANYSPSTGAGASPSVPLASLPYTATLTSGLEISLIGNAQLDVVDSAGHHTGLLPGASHGYETNIPYSGYDSTGDGQVITLMAADAYTVTLHGSQSTGAAILRVSTLVNGVVGESLAYDGIPITTTTTATLTFHLSVATPPVLPADMNMVAQYAPGWPVELVGSSGILSGTAGQDLLPPVVSISMSPDRLVTISAQDEPGGSGVAHIYYSTGNPAGRYQEYSGAFTLPPGMHVTAFASDFAGNVSYTPNPTYLPLIQR